LISSMTNGKTSQLAWELWLLGAITPTVSRLDDIEGESADEDSDDPDIQPSISEYIV